MKIVKFIVQQIMLTIVLLGALVACINVIKMAMSHVWVVSILGALAAVMAIKEVMQCNAKGKKTDTPKRQKTI